MQSITMQLREACRLRAYMPHPVEFLEGMADIFGCCPLDANRDDFFHFLETIYNAGRIYGIRQERDKRRRRS